MASNLFIPLILIWLAAVAWKIIVALVHLTEGEHTGEDTFWLWTAMVSVVVPVIWLWLISHIKRTRPHLWERANAEGDGDSDREPEAPPRQR